MTAFIVYLIIFLCLGMIAFCTFMAMKERGDTRLSAKRDSAWEECRKAMNRISEIQKERSQIIDKLLNVLE